MKYKNAKDVLPQPLFEEVQKYASGELLYFPVSGQRCRWGDKSGNRFRNEKRNREIQNLYRNGLSPEQLSERYYLTPESIKNIIYSKKGTKTNMNLDEILKLYEDAPPLALEKKCQMDDVREWGEVYYLLEYQVTFPERKLMIYLYQYPYTTSARIEEHARIAEAYLHAGCDVCRLVPNRFGALSREVSFEGHDCVVFAEECRENVVPASESAPRLPDGRYVYTDELLSVMAKVGNMHLCAKEPNYAVLFDNSSSCFKQYEDWIAEYTELDLPAKIREKQPDLMELYEKIKDILRGVRETLRPMYRKLPKSAFSAEEEGSVLVDLGGHLAGLCDFSDGGADVCANHFLCLAMQMDEMLPTDYAWLAVHDAEVNRLRIQNVIHSLQVIGKEYTWTEEELLALPLIYRLMLFGRVYYYGTLFGLMDDQDKLKEMLEFIENQLTSPDEINFREILLTARGE